MPDAVNAGRDCVSTSILIARLVGPIMVVVGLAVLANPRLLRDVLDGFLDNRALIFLAGFLTLLAGLTIVNTHNLWVLDWPVVITLIGWLAVVGGIFRIAFPTHVIAMGKAVLAHEALLRAAGVLPLGLGVIFSFVGYL
jgi:hypothetical protein